METRRRDRRTGPVGDRTPMASGPALSGAFYHCELGKLRLETGHYRQALEQFEQALTQDPHDVESWYGRADALACLSRYDEALASLEQARELAGTTDARFWMQKAVLLLMVNQPRSALNCCNQVLWRFPNHVQAWLFRGIALDHLGQSDAACRSYQRIMRPTLPATATAVRRLCHDLTVTHQAS